MAVPPHQQDPWTRVRTAHDLPADEVISSIQKEIRRGHTENAVLLAYEMCVTSPELEAYLWGRLQVISVEDIGFGNMNAPVLIETLFQMHQRIPRPRGDRYMMATHAVRFLCQCEKERGSDYLYNWAEMMVEREGRLPEIPDYALDMHTRRGQEMGRDYEYFLTVAAQVQPEQPGADLSYRDQLLAAFRAGKE